MILSINRADIRLCPADGKPSGDCFHRVNLRNLFFRRFSSFVANRPGYGPARFCGGKPGSGTNRLIRQGAAGGAYRLCGEAYEGGLLQGDGMTGEERKEQARDPIQVFCVHCATGYETKVAERISQMHPEIAALAVIQEKHRSVKGVKSIKHQVMLPGYVFLFSSQPIPFRHILPLQHVIRFLSYGYEEDLALRGDDLRFAGWVRRHDGLMSCSQAVQVGSSLRIVSGPLADHIGTVSRVDRHNRNICLNILFSGVIRKVWMPFQWAEEADITGMIELDEQ